jgi:hypothetical protein
MYMDVSGKVVPPSSGWESKRAKTRQLPCVLHFQTILLIALLIFYVSHKLWNCFLLGGLPFDSEDVRRMFLRNVDGLLLERTWLFHRRDYLVKKGCPRPLAVKHNAMKTMGQRAAPPFLTSAVAARGQFHALAQPAGTYCRGGPGAVEITLLPLSGIEGWLLTRPDCALSAIATEFSRLSYQKMQGQCTLLQLWPPAVVACSSQHGELYVGSRTHWTATQVWAVPSWGGQSPTSHSGGPGSSPGSSHMGPVGTQRQWGRFAPSTSVGFPCHCHSTNCSTIITMIQTWYNRPINGCSNSGLGSDRRCRRSSADFCG